MAVRLDIESRVFLPFSKIVCFWGLTDPQKIELLNLGYAPALPIALKIEPSYSGPVVVDDSGNQLMWIGLICLLDVKQPRG